MNDYPNDDFPPVHDSRWCVLDWFFLVALAALAAAVVAVARMMGL